MNILKKTLLVLGAATAVIGVTACKKDKDNEEIGQSEMDQTKLNELKTVSRGVKIENSEAITKDFALAGTYNVNGVEYKIDWSVDADEHVRYENGSVKVTPITGMDTFKKKAKARIYHPSDEKVYFDFEVAFTVVSEQYLKVKELEKLSVNVKIPASNAITEDITLPTAYSEVTDDFDIINYNLQWTINNDEHVELNNNIINITRPEIGFATVKKTVNVRMFYPGDNSIYYDFSIDFEIVPKQTSSKVQIEAARESIYIPANMNAIVNDINLPTVTYFDRTEFNVQWSVVEGGSYVTLEPYDKEEAKIEITKAKITRPAIGQEDATIKLKATVSGNVYEYNEKGESVPKVETTTKEFTLIVKAEKERNVYDFVDNFEDYEVDTYFSDIQSPYWEYIEENKRIKEVKVVDKITNLDGSQINSKVNGMNALQIASSSVNEAKYDSYVSLGNSFVMECYLLSIDGGNKFEIDYRSSKSSLFKVGINNGEFTINGKLSGKKLDDGVWYKVRMVYDNGNITYSYYDYDTNNLVTIGTETVNTKASDINFVRFSVPAMENAGLSYLSDFKICHELPENIGTNPNRTDGLGNVYDFDGTNESEFDDFIVVDLGSNYTLPELAIYNRFTGDKYSYNVDYTLTTTIKNLTTGSVVDSIDLSVAENYKIEYVFTLVKNAIEPAETKKLERVISVQEVGAKSIISNLKFSTIKGGNMTVRGDLTRENTKLYYYISDTKNETITAQFIKDNGSEINVATNKLNTSLAVGNASIGKYIYLTTVADNGTLGDVYKKMSDGVEEAMTDVNIIKNADQFYDMCTNTDTAKDLFKLDADIDMTGKTWGQSSVVFGGVLDGAGFTVRNIKNESSEVAGGIFYSVENGTIKNINFENCEIIASSECGLFGKQSEGGTFENIKLVNLTVFGNNTNTTDGYVGALAGRARTTGKTTIVKKVSLINDNDHYIKSSRYTGGLFGGIENTICNISDCYIVSPLIDERQCTGGIVGRAKQGSKLNITNCIVNVAISSYKYSGFIIGENELSGTTGTTISNIIISGTIAGGETNKKNFGLISGRLQGKYVSISSILSLGASLTKNSINESIDNSPDAKIHQLDTGVFSAQENDAVALNNPAGVRYMYFESTGIALTKEEYLNQIFAKYQYTGFDFTNTWTWENGNLGLKH